jgi:signal transduction histidine kinase
MGGGTVPVHAGDPPGRPVGDVDGQVLDAVVAATLEGLALLDAEGRYRLVNPAGCRILGLAERDLLDRHAVFGASPAEPGTAGGTRTGVVRWCRPGTGRERVLEHRTVPVVTTSALRAVAFRDVTDAHAHERRLAAFAAAAATAAEAGSLRETLDAICAEVVGPADLAGVQILLLDPAGDRLQVHGAAPAEAWPEHLTLVIEEARRRGARLSSLEAFRTGRPVVRPRRRAALLADPAWEPLHAQLRAFDWEAFVSVPLRVRDRPVGALNAYYRPGHDPDDGDVGLLASMADHAAVAVESAKLVTESRSRATLEERHRLARELHDSACQQLFALALHLRAAQLALPRGPDDEAVRRTLQTAHQLAHSALDDVRDLVLELHPRVLHEEGLVAAVRQRAASTAARTGARITVAGPDAPLGLGPDAELDAYRIVQEALHNILKHAAPTSVRVGIGPQVDDPTTLVLDVVDDGRGFDPAQPTPGIGLTSMRERAERLGGGLTVASAPGAGCLVRVVVPRALPAEPPAAAP